MSAATFATMAPEHVIIFRKNPKSIFDIIMDISNKCVWGWKTFPLSHSNSVIDILKAVRTQTSPCCFPKKVSCRRLQLHRLALTYFNCCNITIKMLSAAFASHVFVFICHHSLLIAEDANFIDRCDLAIQ